MFEQDRIITGRKDKNLLIFKAEDIRWELLFDLSDKQFKRPLHGGRTKLVAETGVKKFFRRCNLKSVSASFDNPTFSKVFYRLIDNETGKHKYDENGYRRKRRGRISNFGTLFAKIGEYIHFESYHLLGIKVPESGLPIKKHVSTYSKPVIRFMRESEFEFGQKWEQAYGRHPELIENLCTYIMANHHDDMQVYRHFFNIVNEEIIIDRLALLVKPIDFKSISNNTANEFGFGSDYKSMFQYILKCIATEAMTPRDVVQEYYDYLKMARKLKQLKKIAQLRESGDMETQITEIGFPEYRSIEKYPRGLTVRHRIVTRNYNVIQSTYDEEKFSALVNRNYEWEDKEFCMVVANNTDDIKAEGVDLNHCIADYIAAILEGRTQICFMRKTEFQKTSYVTVEIRSHRIQQARGYNNRDLDQFEMDWLEKYAKKKNISYGSVVRDEEKESPIPTPKRIKKEDFIGPFPLEEKAEENVE